MVVFIVIVYVVLATAIGGMIGETKGRTSFGFAVGLLFGPLGWIAVGLIEPTAEEAAARRVLQARAIAAAMAPPARTTPNPAVPVSGAGEDRVTLRTFLYERDVDPKDAAVLMDLFGSRSMPLDLRRAMDDAVASELTGEAVRALVAEVLQSKQG